LEQTVVLLSSGLDSTVNFYEALQKTKVELCITLDYGQKAADQEISHASKICQKHHVEHKILETKWFDLFTKTSLVSPQKEIPVNVLLDSQKSTSQSAQSVWVPNRNGIMINIAAGFAEGLGANAVVVGFNKEEAMTFPDNSKEYLEALNVAFNYSTLKKIKVKCYTTHMNKIEIAKRAKELNIDFDLMWPCYFGGSEICQKCESCLRFLRAIKSL